MAILSHRFVNNISHMVDNDFKRKTAKSKGYRYKF